MGIRFPRTHHRDSRDGRVNLTDLHRRLLADVLAIGTPYPLVITGG